MGEDGLVVQVRPKENDDGNKVENHLLMRSGCMINVDGDEKKLTSQKRKEASRTNIMPIPFCPQ